MTVLKTIDLGLVEYKKAWDIQESLFNEILEAKKNNQSFINYLILCQHSNVFTIGKSGKPNNLLINEKFLSDRNISLYYTNRGGDITYHGPGQLVVYPILDLNKFKLGIKEYIYRLEDTVINTLQEYKIKSSRKTGAAGVWIIKDDPVVEKKICAIGVRSSRFITMHGFALNINTNLEYYKFINPCGFNSSMVTSMKEELKYNLNFDEVKNRIQFNLKNIFKINSVAN